MLAKSSSTMCGMASEAEDSRRRGLDERNEFAKPHRSNFVRQRYICRRDTSYCCHVIHEDQTSCAIANPPLPAMLEAQVFERDRVLRIGGCRKAFTV